MVASLGLTALSLIASVVVLRLFFHDPSKPVPSSFRGGNKVKGIISVKPKGKEEESHISLQSQTPLPSAITEYFRTMAVKEDENSDVENNKADWENAARLVDTFCFYVMLVMTIALILFLIIGINSSA